MVKSNKMKAGRVTCWLYTLHATSICPVFLYFCFKWLLTYLKTIRFNCIACLHSLKEGLDLLNITIISCLYFSFTSTIPTTTSWKIPFYYGNFIENFSFTFWPPLILWYNYFMPPTGILQFSTTSQLSLQNAMHRYIWFSNLAGNLFAFSP